MVLRNCTKKLLPHFQAMCDMNWLDVRKSLRTLKCLHIILPRIARSGGSNEDPVNVVTIPAITLSNVDYVRNLRVKNF